MSARMHVNVIFFWVNKKRRVIKILNTHFQEIDEEIFVRVD